MKKYFLDLFEYNNWANDKLILKLVDVNDDIKIHEALKILSHIISAQDTWLERVKGKQSYNIFLWDEYSIQEIEVLSLKSYKNWNKFISKLNEAEFDLLCNYKNSKGIQSAKTYMDILQHVVNHSSYHRGQINLHFRTIGIEPVNIDFIDYC